MLVTLLMLFQAGMAADVAAQQRADRNLIHLDLSHQRFLLSDHVRISGEFPPLPGLHGPVILVFGAWWCQPCHDAIAALHARASELADARAHVIYVHVDDVDRSDGRSRDEIRTQVEEMASAPEFEGVRVLLGGDMLEVKDWLADPGFESLPGIVFLMPDGTIFRRLGGADGFEQAVEDFVEALTRHDAAQQRNPSPRRGP